MTHNFLSAWLRGQEEVAVGFCEDGDEERNLNTSTYWLKIPAT